MNDLRSTPPPLSCLLWYCYLNAAKAGAPVSGLGGSFTPQGEPGVLPHVSCGAGQAGRHGGKAILASPSVIRTEKMTRLKSHSQSLVINDCYTPEPMELTPAI